MHVALLRGINVGGKGLLPMKELAAIFTACGAARVSTYLQSGNVLFAAAKAHAAEISSRVTAEIARVYGYPGRIVLRSASEYSGVLAANPFPGVPEESLHVYFMADAPDKEAVVTLDATRSRGDSFTVLGREIYLHVPNGMARTKLTNQYFDSRLKTVCTARGWKSVCALARLLEAPASAQ